MLFYPLLPAGVLKFQHGQLPQIMVKGEAIHDLYFEVSGCCSSLIDETLDKISEVIG